MTRKALVLQRVEDARSRKSTYTKRRKSVFKKAMELGVLCGVKVAVCVWDEKGNLSLFGTTDPVKLVRAAAAGLDKHAGPSVTSDQLLAGSAAGCEGEDDDSDDDDAAPQTRSKKVRIHHLSFVLGQPLTRRATTPISHQRRRSETSTPPWARTRRSTRTAQRAEQAAATAPALDGAAAPAAVAPSPPHVPAAASKSACSRGAAPVRHSMRRRSRGAAAKHRIAHADGDADIALSSRPVPAAPPALHPGGLPLGVHRPPPLSLSGAAGLGDGGIPSWSIGVDPAMFAPGFPGTALFPSVLAQASLVAGTMLLPSSGSGSPSLGWSEGPFLRASASPVTVIPSGDPAHGHAACLTGMRSPRGGAGPRAPVAEQPAPGLNRNTIMMSTDSMSALLAVSAAAHEASEHEAPRSGRGRSGD